MTEYSIILMLLLNDYYFRIQINGKMVTIGTSFDDEVVAARARDAYIMKHGLISKQHPLCFPSSKYLGRSSKYLGVGWHKRDKKWRVNIKVGGKMKSLGNFADEIAAARAYDAFVIAEKLNKPLNFPGDPVAKKHAVVSSKPSHFRGVFWNKSRKKWEVKIRVDGKCQHIGYVEDEIEAAHAYDAYAIANGIDTPRNLPDEDDDGVVTEAARVRAAPKKRKNAASKTSRFRGVSWSKQNKKWMVYINIVGKKKYIGHFADEIEAAHVYDAYAIANGIDTPRNFPNEAEDAVVAEAERGRAAKKQKKAASKSSRFRGVCWDKQCKKWKVFIRVEGKSKSIGLFADEMKAAHAYDAYAIANGIDTPRNLPDEDEDDVVDEAERGLAAKKRDAKTTSSRFRGLTWNKQGKSWQVRMCIDGKKHSIGRFIDEVEAAHAYDAYAIANGFNRPRNFPGEDEDAVVAAAARVLATKKKKKKAKANSSSQHRGVVWIARNKKWRVYITIDGKTKSLGSFNDEEKAGRAFDTYVIDNNLDRPLNFPDGAASTKAAAARAVAAEVAISHGVDKVPDAIGTTPLSTYTCVRWHYRSKSWRVYLKDKSKHLVKIPISSNGATQNHGTQTTSFVREIDAARAYDAAVLSGGPWFGGCRLNFPLGVSTRSTLFKHGVRWATDVGKFEAFFGAKHCGHFETDILAAKCYDRFAKTQITPLSTPPLNFPERNVPKHRGTRVKPNGDMITQVREIHNCFVYDIV